MKKSIFSILGILIFFLLIIACTSNKGDEPMPEPVATNKYVANLNPTDPNLFNITTTEGNKIYLFGEKDDNGMPVKLNTILMQQEGLDEMMEMHFDEKNRIKEFVTETGIRMVLDWVDDTKAALTLIEPETGEQLNTVIDLDNNDKGLYSKNTEDEDQIPRSGDVTFNVRPLTNASPSVYRDKQNASPYERTGLIQVTGCSTNLPIDGTVYVKVYRAAESDFTSNQFLNLIYCKRIGTGLYEYTIPSSYFKEVKLSDYCDKIAEIAIEFCNSQTNFFTKQAACEAITVALALGTVTAPAAAAFGSICYALNVFTEAYCFADMMTGIDGFKDILCPQIEAHDKTVYENTIIVRPFLHSLKKDVEGTPGVFTASQPLIDLKISTGGNPTIQMFTLNPPVPAARQSYLAVANLSCLPKGTYITMHIVGTDSYVKTVHYTVENDELNYEATMSVPGAESGVKDIVTITAEIPSGGTITKTASLVFQ